MLVHDGLFHKRFDASFLLRIPRFQRIVDAHAYHHQNNYEEPYGLFLGPEELECKRRGVEIEGMPIWCWALLIISLLAIGGGFQPTEIQIRILTESCMLCQDLCNWSSMGFRATAVGREISKLKNTAMVATRIEKEI